VYVLLGGRETGTRGASWVGSLPGDAFERSEKLPTGFWLGGIRKRARRPTVHAASSARRPRGIRTALVHERFQASSQEATTSPVEAGPGMATPPEVAAPRAIRREALARVIERDSSIRRGLSAASTGAWAPSARLMRETPSSHPLQDALWVPFPSPPAQKTVSWEANTPGAFSFP
jgi:hypothetical protein